MMISMYKFVLKWDRDNQELDLVAKSIMRKKTIIYKTSNNDDPEKKKKLKKVALCINLRVKKYGKAGMKAIKVQKQVKVQVQKKLVLSKISTIR